MIDEATIAQPAVQQSPADTATTAAMDAQVSGNTEKAQPLFDKAAVLHRRAEAAQATGDDSWRDGTDAAPLSPMPDAPTLAPSEVDAAIDKMNNLGGDHAELVSKWGSDFGDNFAYAKSAFADVAANRPDLIAKFDRSGLGDDAAVIEFLSRHGRLSAGLMGTMPKNSGPSPMPTFVPSSPSSNSGNSDNTNNNGALETKGELNRLLAANPPGSMGYKTNAGRISQLYGMLAGTGSVIGKGGRRV